MARLGLARTADGRPDDGAALSAPPEPAASGRAAALAKRMAVDSRPTAADPSERRAPAPPRTLRIRLFPAELGSVAVRLVREGGDLSVRIEASRAGTAQLLRRDGRMLASLPKGAGAYDAVTLAIV